MYLLWAICDWTLRWVIGLVCHEYYESWMNRLLSDTAIVLWIPVLFSRCLQVSVGKYETFSYITSTYLCLYDVCTVFSILLHRGLDSAWQLWLDFCCYLLRIFLGISKDNSDCQLLDLIIPEIKSYMTCYNSMPLSGWNYWRANLVKDFFLTKKISTNERPRIFNRSCDF